MGNLAVSNNKFLDYLRANEITYPIVISIDLVENCNYRCKHCYIKYSFQKDSDYLSYEELDDLFRQMGEYGVASVNLTGGEPLLRKDIIDIIKSAKRNKLHCCLKTNGFFLNKDLIDIFKEIELDEVVLSVYGMSDEEYMVVTGYSAAIKENVFGKFKDNIQYLISRIKTELRYVLLQQNYKSYGTFVEWCKEIGLKQGQYDFIIDITPDNNLNEDTHDNGLDIIQQEEFLKNLYNIDREFFLSRYRDDYNYKKCLVGKQFNHIKCNGDVYPCPNFPIVVGNIRNQTFQEIWEDSSVLNELRDIPENELECGSCKNKKKCYYPCMAAIYVWNKCDSYTKSNASYCNYKTDFYSIVNKIKREVDS